MIEVVIPKDIMKYKATLIGPFTTRQTICLCITGIAEYSYFKLIKMLPMEITLDSAAGIAFLIAVMIMSFGIIEPFGIPLEKYLKNVLVLGLLAPKNRVYKTSNLLAKERTSAKKTKQRTFSKKELKKHPDYIMYL